MSIIVSSREHKIAENILLYKYKDIYRYKDIPSCSVISNNRLRHIRETIYRRIAEPFDIFATTPPCRGSRKLTAEKSLAKRRENFNLVMKTHGRMLRDPSGDFALDGVSYAPAKDLKRSSQVVQTLAIFANTDYGSSVIKELVEHPADYKIFLLRENPEPFAGGIHNLLMLPNTFPGKVVYGSHGRQIYDLAVIYHEFAHTMVFRPDSAMLQDITSFDELWAVKRFENPVRIQNGIEPRYYYIEMNSKYTINILTREIRTGSKWDVSKYNPCELVDSRDPNALGRQEQLNPNIRYPFSSEPL